MSVKILLDKKRLPNPCKKPFRANWRGKQKIYFMNFAGCEPLDPPVVEPRTFKDTRFFVL